MKPGPRPARPSGNPFAARSHGGFTALAPGVLLWRSIVNSTVVVGQDAIAVIDTQVNHAAARRLVTAIQTRFRLPIRWVINTHYHWDHCHGNALFAAAGATIVASRRTALACIERQPRQKEFLSSRGFDLGPNPLVATTFTDDLPIIDLGGLTLHCRNGQAAETADPTLVWCPEARILVSGDTVMTGSFPIFGQPNQREGLENSSWVSALDEIRGFDPLLVAPGHGPAAGSSELDLFTRIIEYFLIEVRSEYDAGRSLSEAITRIERRLPPWIGQIPEVWGTPRYAILRVWAGLADLGEPGWQHCKPHALGTVTAATISTELAEVGRWKELAEQALEGGDARQAAGAAAAVVAQHPHDPSAWTARGDILLSCARAVRSTSILEKGDCFGPARDAYAHALAIDPNHGPALLGAGRFRVFAAFRNGDDPEVGERFLDRAECDPSLTSRQRAELWLCRGLAARSRSDERRAGAAFRRALLCSPGYVPALLALRA